MLLLKKSGTWLSVLAIVFVYISSSQAALISTSEALTDSNRAQLVKMLEREDVRKQMIAMGVDPEASLARVAQLTHEEVAQLNGQIDELIAGAGVSTVELLLIILIVILIL